MSRDWGDLGDFTEMNGFKKFPELGDLFGVAKPRNSEYDGFVKSVELPFHSIQQAFIRFPGQNDSSD